jgi:Transposase zinc-binding domain/Putative transposase
MAREGLEVADVFRHFGPAFRDRHGASLSTARRRAMSAIEHCRTAALGGHVERCGECGHQRIAYNSCRNRNCPKCQGLARAQWLEDRQAELLDVPYFHVVFTVPDEIAAIAFQNQTVVYDVLFRAASETLRTIAADPKHLGAEIGFLAVLHTWGQNLSHHPHLHCLVPGGGIAPDGRTWIACRPGFFLPVRVRPVPPSGGGADMNPRPVPCTRPAGASWEDRLLRARISLGATRVVIGSGCDAQPAPAGDRVNQHSEASSLRLHNLVAAQRVSSGRVFCHPLVSGAGPHLPGPLSRQ